MNFHTLSAYLYSLNHVVPLSLQATIELMWYWLFLATRFPATLFWVARKPHRTLTANASCRSVFMVHSASLLPSRNWDISHFRVRKIRLLKLSEYFGDRKARQKDTSASIWFNQQIHQIWWYSYLPLSFSKTLRIPTSSFCRHQ